MKIVKSIKLKIIISQKVPQFQLNTTKNQLKIIKKLDYKLKHQTINQQKKNQIKKIKLNHQYIENQFQDLLIAVIK